MLVKWSNRGQNCPSRWENRENRENANEHHGTVGGAIYQDITSVRVIRLRLSRELIYFIKFAELAEKIELGAINSVRGDPLGGMTH
jgi:hypothetical protein